MTSGQPRQMAREVLLAGAAPVDIRRAQRDVLLADDAPVDVRHIQRDVLLADDGQVDIHQASRAVLRSVNAPVHVRQVYRQVLRSRRDSPYPNFPVRLFCPPALSARLEGGATAGGVSLGGDQAVEAMDAGARWAMDFAEAPLWNREMVKTWRQFVTACDGGVMPCIVPMWDRRHQPFVAAKLNVATTFAAQVWRDTPLWSADEVQASVAADCPAHTTSIAFTFAGGVGPDGGEHFSVYRNRFGWRLYRLIRKTAEVDGVQTWEIRPPLREWLGAGTALNFDSPRCTMRVEGDLAEVVELMRLGRGKATFVESFARYP